MASTFHFGHRLRGDFTPRRPQYILRGKYILKRRLQHAYFGKLSFNLNKLLRSLCRLHM
jgi:hypothetical protein